jgi:hypothetical protein
MPSRQDSFGFGTTLPAATVRLIDAAAEIMGDPEADEMAFLHTVLAQCCLPYREPHTRDYFHENGRASLVISAGYLMNENDKPVLQGVPYGAKPRLLMTHLCTEAVRTKSAVIPVGDSMSAFMRDLGLKVTGGKEGSIGRFKEQLNRLAASRMQLMFRSGDMRTTLNPAPIIKQFDVWFPTDARQKMLWPSEVTLSDEFFQSLQGHALPLDPRALRALQHNARALDIYTWLAHRLPRVKERNGAKVSWAALHGQFGNDVKDYKTFRRGFKKALTQAVAVYPDANVEPEDGGLRLRSSQPPIRRKLVGATK